MTRDEAKDKLLEIKAAVEEIDGHCIECPFHEMPDGRYFCSFAMCPVYWENLKGESERY